MFKNKLLNCGHKDVLDHPFLNFYIDRLEKNLKPEIEFSKKNLAFGVLHGDPFFDNIFVDEASGDFSGFVDMEDCCYGPLLFDLACCVIGSSYEKDKEGRNNGVDVLNFDFLTALLRGYCSERKLSGDEMSHFINFMKLTLLCNCSWRFVNFWVDHRDAGCREAFTELRDRIQQLDEDGALCEKIALSVGVFLIPTETPTFLEDS